MIPEGGSGNVRPVPEICHSILFNWNSWHVCEEWCCLDRRCFALKVYENFPKGFHMEIFLHVVI